MLLSQVKQINPLLNPKPVELGIGSYAGTEGSQANTNLSNISNVLPFALPMATMGLISQAPNIINKEISAQDVIDNHLNRDYKTYEGGYNINEASIYTPQGVIHQPDPVDPETLEEWKRRNILSTPTYEPNIDDYSTGGDQPEINIPNSTGSPPVDLNLPTHTGSPPVEANIPNILYTLKTIYHGTDKDFDEFDVKQSASGSIWFTDRKDKIESQEVGASGFGKIIEKQIDEGKINLAEGWSNETEQLTADQLIQRGYDGIKYSENNENTYALFFPEKLLDNKGLLEESNIKEGLLGKYEEGKGMAVIHNTGASAIQNYDNIGGIPKPSLAVVPENVAEMKFGEITLVGDPELMIPSKSNPVYKGDAYTQRYPNVRTIYSDNEMDQIIGYFSNIFEVDDIRYDYSKISDFKFEDESNQAMFYTGDLYNQIIEKGINNLPTDMMDMAFLKEKGLLPDFNLAKDKYAYKRLLEEVFTPELNAEYKEWNKSLSERIGVEGKEKIIAGRTPMGKLRYKDHTLENVLSHMKTNAGKEEGFGGSGNIGNLAATMRGKFKNKKELSEARDTFVTSEEMSDIKSDLYTELSRITELLAKENKHLDPESFEIGDNFSSIFGDKKYSIEQNFKEFYPDTSEETKQEIIQFLEKLAGTPSEYFEIKPNRALQMNEFKGAIVPNNTDEKTLQILKDNGIEIKKYNTEKERLDLLKEFEDLFASMPVNPLFNYA